MSVPVMAISNLVLTQQIYSEETNGAHAHYREPVPSSIYFACLQLSPFAKQWFYTVFGPFLKIKSANMHRWNIFPIKAVSMLAWPQILTGNLPIKRQAFPKGRFLRWRSCKFQFVWQNDCITTFPWPGCFKTMLAYVIHPQNTKNSSCVGARCAFR